MTDRRVWWLLGAIPLLTACGQVVAGDSQQPDGSAVVELGPLPTRVAAPRPATPTTVAAGRTSTSIPTNSPSTTSTLHPTTSTVPAGTTTGFPRVKPNPTKTSCSRVAYIGDSVSLGMVTSEEMPNPRARLDKRLAEVGVRELRVEVSGGRSIVETLSGQENAHDVAVRLRAEGFTGCWILAVGTNDAANIAAGGKRQATDRITSMMSVIGTEPVLWLDAATIAVDGYWASTNIAAWNEVLRSLAPSYPNLRIAPWSTFVGTQWFQPDGVHLTDAGSVARVEFVASALVAVFPGR
ncbi:MAG TPA: hypothetical protein VLD86_14320 [Ilumatobacteraceae bacterium]|nr:hypothetical protein [Ilumatobacteraceae bacterium]